MPSRYVLLGTDCQGRPVLELQSSWSGSKWESDCKVTLASWNEAWQRLEGNPLAGVPFPRGLRERESVPPTLPSCKVCGLNITRRPSGLCRACEIANQLCPGVSVDWLEAHQTAQEGTGGANGS